MYMRKYMDLGIPPLRSQNTLGSNPLKSGFFVRGFRPYESLQTKKPKIHQRGVVLYIILGFFII